jgi:rare lipoprotein A (peptidoglycan hydrolase)
VAGRIIDLSPEAFGQLASLGRGVIDIRLNW